MTDTEIIDYIATQWIINGGDSTGFCYCEKRILDRIRELERMREEANAG